MSQLQTLPRRTTWEALQQSRNQAAIATLASGLSSPRGELRQLCLKTLLARPEEAAQRAVLLHWEQYDAADIELLRPRGASFAGLVRELLSQGSLTEKRTALGAVSDLDLHDVLDSVLEIVVNPTHALASQATRSMREMCERWGARARLGKDVPTIRGKMLERMGYQMGHFHQHHCGNLIEAWLCLVHWDDSLQRGLIADPRHVAYRGVLACLGDSQHPAVIQLLAGYLGRTATPKCILEILTQRANPELAVAIAQLNEGHLQTGMLKRLQCLSPLKCLVQIEHQMPSVGVELERRLWLMVAASSDDLAQVLRGAIRLSKLGTREARQTAAEMLRTCRRPRLDELVPALQQAACANDSHQPSLGNLIRQIATWMGSPSLTLKKAARDFFRDFTTENLLEQVRQWPSELCRAMADIVNVVESDVTLCLTRELQNPAPRRRLAALQATQLLGCVDRVSQALMPLLDDPRLEVRVRAIDVLGALGHEALEQLIPRLLEDASTDIQDAANRAVRRINRLKRKVPTPLAGP